MTQDLRRFRIAFLASNQGSSARAIVDAIRAGDVPADAALLASNRKDSAALAWARELDVPTACIPTIADPDAADTRLCAALTSAGADLVVLSGYLRKLGPHTLAAFAGRIVNIHPGPLPAFGGQGMYGRRVHDAVIAAGVAESGMTIHVVDEEYDHGPEVASRAVPVLSGDTAETLEARVRAAEPAFFAEVVGRIVRGELALPRT